MEIEIIRVFNNVYFKESYKKAYNRKVQIDYRIAFTVITLRRSFSPRN